MRPGHHRRRHGRRSPSRCTRCVEYGRFRSARGTRAALAFRAPCGYGVGNSVTEMQQKLNRDLCLMAQVETAKAMKNLDQLAAVPGVDLFVGPADLAASLGIPAKPCTQPSAKLPARVVQAARANGKCIASACGPSDFKFWLDQKIDLLFCTNDIACLKRGAALALDEARALVPPLAQAAELPSPTPSDHARDLVDPPRTRPRGDEVTKGAHMCITHRRAVHSHDRRWPGY